MLKHILIIALFFTICFSAFECMYRKGQKEGYCKGYDAGQNSLVVLKDKEAPSEALGALTSHTFIVGNGGTVDYSCPPTATCSYLDDCWNHLGMHWKAKNGVCFADDDPEQRRRHTQKLLSLPSTTRGLRESEFKKRFSWAEFTYANEHWRVDAVDFSGNQVGGEGSTFNEAVKAIEKKLDGCGTVTPFGPEFDPHRGVKGHVSIGLDFNKRLDIDNGILMPIPSGENTIKEPTPPLPVCAIGQGQPCEELKSNMCLSRSVDGKYYQLPCGLR